MLVVGLNQTIDRTIRLPALAPGQVLRALDARVTPGGKAVNVCRAARTVVHPGSPGRAVPGRLGAVARELLLAEGLDVEAVAVDGEIRGTTVVLEDGGRTTVINEPGPALDSGAWRRVLAAVEQGIVGGAWMAVCGSVPPGVDPGAHAALIALAHDRGAPVAVDVTGGRLVEAAAAGADLVSPNLAEAEDAVRIAGGSPVTVGEAVDVDDRDRSVVEARCRAAGAALVALGAGAAMVSAGRHGVACATAARDDFVPAPAVDVVNPIGAGDALLGATLVALERGRPFEVAVREGVAYAAASVADPVAGYADPTVVAALGRELAR